MDLSDENAPISSIPVPLTNEVPASNWNKEHSLNEYRPTPEVDEELLSNARVIHGITSVPNRNGMKRYLQLDEGYQECMKKFDEISKKTSYQMSDVVEEGAKPASEAISTTNNNENTNTKTKSEVENE